MSAYFIRRFLGLRSLSSFSRRLISVRLTDFFVVSFISFYEQYLEYDPALTVQEPSNPWISDSTELWDLDKSG